MNKLKIAIVTILSLALYGNVAMADDMVQVKGSDTLINMVQKLSEVYMAKKPGTAIAVTGGGSGTGIAGLINKRCDIANSSRGIKSSEVEQANKKGVDPKRIVVAIDALSIIVNKNNPVDKLTVDQIGKIYRGEIKNWSEVGGADLPVTLYGRQSNSGTYDFMKESVMFGEYSPTLKSMNGNAQIVESITHDSSGIGYVGIGYAKDASGIKSIKVAARQGSEYYDPFNYMDVKTGRYPISRPLNQYINGTPKGIVKDFIIFELSAEGQAIIEKEGFFQIPEEYQAYNDQVLERSGTIRESPMRPKDLSSNLGAG